MSKLEQLIKELCPNGVEYKKLGDIATDIFRGAGITRDQVTEEGTPCVRYGEIYTTYGIYFDTCVSHTDESTIQSKKYFEHGDILFAITGESVEDIAKSTAYVGHEKCLAGGDIVVLKHNQNPKYLSYVLSTTTAQAQKSKGKVKSKVVHSSVPAIKEIVIPVPPIEVQAEIVKILDNFTELTAELTARKKQYEYYRDLLLDFGVHGGASECEWRTLGEISKYRRGSFPQPYGNKEWYDGEGAMPFVQVADIMDNMCLVPDTNRKISLKAQPKSVFAPKGSIIISLQGSIGRIAVTQYDAYIDRTIAIFTEISDIILSKYFVYQLQRVFSIKEKTARGSTIKTITKEEFTSFPVPIPSIKEQKRIVSILDRFDKLCNDISEGLPAEIEARRKQYEYYRDKLLSFEERKNA